ncbi:ABC transporter permease [Natronobacterium texcoconense]|uniref:ABC-2 type transport system permease protein n=1 Tax=Natronobacterium texcoconense TaxID=1095778 RepID=A0A1H1BBN7_NATTX|nr:ABC transporter permease [Natronobacterium texcoconense]SDQ49329.1 ABC-2 type transport system permease protein [Natronobacterium texcoconense]
MTDATHADGVSLRRETGTVPWTRQAWAFARRHLQQLVRRKTIAALTIAWPICWYALTLVLFVDDADALTRAALGMTFGLFGAFTVTVAVFAGEFARDLETDRYRKLRAMPISPTADLAGRFTAGVAIGTGSYVATIVAAVATGARFEAITPTTIVVLVLTLVTFCLIAMALALLLAVAVPKPEYMTTIAVVTVLVAFYLTGQNGIVPHMIAGSPEIVNFAPNSLATRLQLVAWAGPENVGFMTPPDPPSLPEHVALLAGYGVGLVAVSVALVSRVAYGGE